MASHFAFCFPVVTLWLSSSMASHFAFCFLLWHRGYFLWWLPTLLSIFLFWHCGSLLRWLPTLLSVSCCYMVIFFNGCPLCVLFSAVTLWLSSSMASHFAFCFLLWHCGYLLQWLPTLLSDFCCDRVVIFFDGFPLCFLFSCCDIVVIVFNGCQLCILFSAVTFGLSSLMASLFAFCFLVVAL